jgi:zinc protease
MSPGRRLGREELAAVALAIVLVLVGAGWLWRSDATRERCCASERSGADSLIPPDLLLRSGRLDNGLRYYIRSHGAPRKRAELRLVVDAGSVLEADDERGLAHAVEHMLFRGTTHFPRRTVQDYLESVGMRNGQDLNAHTSRDETTYELRVPTERLGVLDTAIAMLADMAHEGTFDAAEARVESGIVLAEWRSDRSAAERLAEQQDAIITQGSRYATRSPIGDTAVIRRFDVAAMRRFYERWYRPDRMAIIVAGDIDPIRVELLVKQYFGPIPAPAAPTPRPAFDVPRARGVRTATLTDPEAAETELSFWIPHPAIRRSSREGYRQRVLVRLWQSIIGARLREAVDEPDSPFLSVSVNHQNVARPVDAEVLSAVVPDGMLEEATTRMVAELTRLARDGPDEREVREKAEALLRRYRESARWADDADDLVSSYGQDFLVGDRVLTRATSLELANAVLPKVGVRDVAAIARRMALDSGAFVFATTRPNPGGARLSSTMLARAVTNAARRTVAQRHERADSMELLSHPPPPGSVRSTRPLPEVGAFDWTLSNGMRLILKPTRFSFDNLDFRLVSPGGSSLASDVDYASAFYADEVIRATGIGQLSGRQLERRLDSSSIDLSVRMNDAALSFSGSATPDDLELLFQVFHLYFTAPRADTLAYRRWFNRSVALAGRRGRDPDLVFDDSLAAAIAQHHPRSLRFGRAFMQQVQMPRALGFWRARTANAANFTLLLSGDFTLDRVRTLAERYLANLSAGTKESPRQMGMRFPSAAVTRAIRMGEGPKARTSIVLSGGFDVVEGSSEALALARQAAELALEERLRETLGATYGVRVSATADLVPPSSYTVTIEFESDPAQIDTLSVIALRELERLRTTGPTAAELAKVRASRVRELDDSMDDNSYWVGELAWHSRPGFLLTNIAGHQERARALTAEVLRNACTEYLGTTRSVRMTMYPRPARPHAPPESPSAGEGDFGDR